MPTGFFSTICGFRRSRPGIPSVIRAPFQSDGAHHSNLMARRKALKGPEVQYRPPQTNLWIEGVPSLTSTAYPVRVLISARFPDSEDLIASGSK